MGICGSKSVHAIFDITDLIATTIQTGNSDAFFEEFNKSHNIYINIDKLRMIVKQYLYDHISLYVEYNKGDLHKCALHNSHIAKTILALIDDERVDPFISHVFNYGVAKYQLNFAISVMNLIDNKIKLSNKSDI